MKATNYRHAAGFTAVLLSCTLASCGGPKGPTPPPKLEKKAPDFVAELNKELVPLAL